MNLKTHESFQFSITANYNEYDLRLNGEHFADYYHRLPTYSVQYYNVYGDDLKIEEIKLETATLPYQPGDANSTSTTIVYKEDVLPIRESPKFKLTVMKTPELIAIGESTRRIQDQERYSLRAAFCNECCFQCLTDVVLGIIEIVLEAAFDIP